MPTTRYSKQCYHMLRRLDEIGRKTWASKIKNVLYEYGFGYVWIYDGVGNCSQFLKCFERRHKDCSLKNLQQKIRDSSEVKMLSTL